MDGGSVAGLDGWKQLWRFLVVVHGRISPCWPPRFDASLVGAPIVLT
jgi:hypothetical protein